MTSAGLACLRRKLATWALAPGPAASRDQHRAGSHHLGAHAGGIAPDARSGSVLNARRSIPRPHLTSSLSRHVAPFSTSSIALSSSSPSSEATSQRLADGVRSLMRSSAQPVVLLLVLLPPPTSGSDGGGGIGSDGDSAASVHGATLSSFTTISLSPPLVAFSLQMPSRAANALIQGKESKRYLSTSSSSTARAAGAAEQDESPAHFVVNILASEHASLAERYAKPGQETFALSGDWDLEADGAVDVSGKPRAVEEGERGREHPLDAFRLVPSSASHGGVPVPRISQGLGSLACELVRCIDTKELVGEGGGQIERNDDEKHGSRSILFIAKVHDVHGVEDAANGVEEGKGEENLPLVYWDRRMTTVRTGKE